MKNSNNRIYLPIYPSILQENEIKQNYLDEIDYLSLNFFLPYKNTLNLKTFSNKIIKNKNKDLVDNEMKKTTNIEKIISLQYYKRKREDYLKEIILKFLEKSNIIKNLSDEIKIEEISNENMEENKKFLSENTKMMKISRILNSLSELIFFQKFYKSDFILKQNDLNENVYILISGSLSLLKPIELIIDEMSYDEFIKYILYLLKDKEKYLLEKILKNNPKIFYLEKYEELNKIIKCYIKIKIYNYIKKHLNTITYFKIEKKFENYLQNFQDYNIVPKELKDVLFERVKDEKKWKEYVNKYFKPNIETYIYFNNYNYLIANKHIKKKVILYKYEIFKVLKPGDFFGLIKNEENELNNVTNNHIEYSIRCEKDSVVGYVSFKHYYNLINEENKKFKTKELNTLLKNFFFKGFSLVLFEKYYFNYFKEVIFNKDKIIFSQGDKFKDIYLLRQGKIKLEFYGSIIDIHNNIRYIIEKIWEKNIWNLKEEDILNLKNTYLNEPDILLLKYKDEIFKEEMNKNQKFNLFILNTYDTIGLECMFLESPYLTNCKIISQNGIFFKIKPNIVEKIVKNENEIKLQYNTLIYNKLISYIERLNSFKKNFIKIVKFKIKKDLINIRNNKINTIDKSIHEDFTYKLDNYLKNNKSELKLKNKIINNNSIKKYIESYNNKNTNNNKFKRNNFLSNRTNSNYTNIFNIFNFSDRQSTIDKNSKIKNLKIKNFKKIFSYQTIDNNNENKYQNSKLKNKHINISQDTIIQNKKGFIRINKKIKNLSRNLKNNSISINSNTNIDKNNNYSNNSYISIINLSSNREYSDENLSNNKKNIFQNNLVRKNKKLNRPVSQDNIYKNITKTLDENSEKNYNKTIEKIKNFYETKKFLGYSSIINLDNNKYCVQRLLYKKNENKIKFRKNFMKGILIQNIKKVKKFVNKNN